MRVYLAGPEVFLADAEAIAAAKKAICAAHGLAGVFPTDHRPDADGAPVEEHRRIYRLNEAHIRDCDALIANLTPFRGPSADSGTAYELGFMRALGRPVLAYTNTRRDFAGRTLAHLTPHVRRRGAETWEDEEGMGIEAFGLADNLMLDGGVLEAGFFVEREEVAPADRWRDLAAFTRCVAALAALAGTTEEKPDAAG
ncbi:nucleoside 2-deoxyribosyltransferase [Plastoroseomonas arctica]|uniref:Nucleoside 2-deoxyribosyltransferase n=1 Tax=Plastoroseomonas arctica TaxID=1509237 RepID=A0AAF1KR44_9PROT|nr:nucleoside 2-deoxyribosyltransferase [Plastoroseomonas arctica]MBR0653862.1 nucleoside 2-deoxyribosyltransferase [Plastoroseomonas arctica]